MPYTFPHSPISSYNMTYEEAKAKLEAKDYAEHVKLIATLTQIMLSLQKIADQEGKQQQLYPLINQVQSVQENLIEMYDFPY